MFKNKWKKDVPVYLFTGFLESGKTKFIKEALLEDEFTADENNLVIFCEEGEIELDKTDMEAHSVIQEIIDSEENITVDYFELINDKCRPDKILLEYNGMWQLDNLYNSMPDNWVICQEMTFFQTETFMMYNSNMRNLVYDKLRYTDMVIFNRFPEDADFMEYHKIVRTANRSTQIIYEDADGKVKIDDIEDPLPFDVEADVIDLEDKDYAYWYRDITADPAKYKGKTIIFNGVMKTKGLKAPDKFVFGRPIMTCCAEDIEFAGIRCVSLTDTELSDNQWAKVRCECSSGYSKEQDKSFVVLKVFDIQYDEMPEDVLATFY